ncbi:MAG TPA: hypothetical protein VEX64_08345 [Pyrinomonadaceae bacterium]|jgi:uncharacterized membrane protein YqjE|nr:hypothetical protein [Pyrinomonadaceae bacterium]
MAEANAPEQKPEVARQLNVSERPVSRMKTNLRGVVNPHLVRIISFIVITVSLVACTVLCIIAIWESEPTYTMWRAIGTFIVVIIATAIFTVVNEKLG